MGSTVIKGTATWEKSQVPSMGSLAKIESSEEAYL
jgi:hypothetical protein